MNNPTTAKPETHLLESIRTIQARIGNGLNDNEFTCLLQKTVLPTEAGFGFLSYFDRMVMLSVPQQDLAKWYPDKGWIVAEKEKIARILAEKHQLTFYEPPDVESSDSSFPHISPYAHHHLTMTFGREIIIVIHPLYLKVRLFHTKEAALDVWTPERPLLLDRNLLQNLAALYQS